MEQKALKMCFSNAFSTKAVFSSNLKLNKVTNILTNVSLRSSGGLKLGKRNTCCLALVTPQAGWTMSLLTSVKSCWTWKINLLKHIEHNVGQVFSFQASFSAVTSTPDQSTLLLIRNTTRTYFLCWQQPLQELADWKRNEASTTSIVKSRREEGKLNRVRQKASKKRLQITIGSTVSTVYYCMDNRAKLMYWLSLISEFWYNLTSECSASNLNVLQI